MKKYYIYTHMDSYNESIPDVILEADLVEKGENYFIFRDKHSLVHYISLNNIISVVSEDKNNYCSSIIIKKLYIYLDFPSYNDSNPNVTLECSYVSRAENYIEIRDTEGYVHYVSLLKPLSVVEERC